MEALLLGLLLLVPLLMFGLASLKQAAPTIYLLPYCVLSILNALIGDATSLHLLMLLTWLAVFLIVTVFCARNEIRIFDFRVTFDSSFGSSTAQRWRFVIFVAGFFLAVAFWVSQSGANEFASQKRLNSSSEFYMFANFFVSAYILFPIYVFGLKTIEGKIGFQYKFFALVVLAWTFVQGYLSSDRGLFFFTFLLIIVLRTCQQTQFASRIRIALLGLFVLLAQIPILAQIAEERANREGEGYEILYEQAFSTESGYGFAVAKDEAVYDFVEWRGPVMDPVYLLGGIYGPVPRVLWEGKPTYVDSGPLAGALVFRHQRWVTPGASIPISFPAEMVLAFGTSAFWLGLILYGALASCACLLLKRWPQCLVPVTLFITQLAGGGLPKSMAGLIINVIALLLMTRLVGLRVVNLRKKPFQRKSTALPLARRERLGRA